MLLEFPHLAQARCAKQERSRGDVKDRDVDQRPKSHCVPGAAGYEPTMEKISDCPDSFTYWI